MNGKPHSPSFFEVFSQGVFLWLSGGLLFWLTEVVFVLISLPGTSEFKFLSLGMSAIAAAKVALRPEKMALASVVYILVSLCGGMISSGIVSFIYRKEDSKRIFPLIGSLFISSSFFIFWWFWLNDRFFFKPLGIRGLFVSLLLILASMMLLYFCFRILKNQELQGCFQRFVAFTLALDFFMFGELLLFRHFSFSIYSLKVLLWTIGLIIVALGVFALIQMVFRLKPFCTLMSNNLRKWVLPINIIVVVLSGLILVIVEGWANLGWMHQKKSKFKGPNIVFIVMDTVRADHLSCYRYGKTTTPHLDQIAKEGVVFRNVVSPSSWTLPSHASMFTGLFTFEHGASYRFSYLPNEFETLAEILKAQGYKTLAYSNNPWVSFRTGLHRGFDDFLEGWREGQNRAFYQIISNKFILFYDHNDPTLSIEDSGAAKTNRYLVKWVKAHRKNPFFIFINYMEAHLPYKGTPLFYAKKYIPDAITKEEIKRYSPNVKDINTFIKERERGFEELAVINGLYDGQINYLDEKIGELYQLLKELNLADATLFIITSDHGENLGEHGVVGHVYGLYDTLLKVPLIIRYPKYFKPGLEVENKVQTTDIFYTILDAVSIKRSPSRLKMAKSLPLRLKEGNFDDIMISEQDRPNHVLRWARKEAFPAEHVDKDLMSISMIGYKYIFSNRGEEELYDLKADPSESHNLASEKKEISAALKSKLVNVFKTDWPRPTIGRNIKMDKETESRLRSLGYIK